jgi:hypothetical protein
MQAGAQDNSPAWIRRTGDARDCSMFLWNCRKVARRRIIWLEAEGAQRKLYATARQRRPLDNVLRPVGVFYVLLARKRAIINDGHQ